MPFDVAGARSAGYSDSEIASFLGSQSGFDVDGAVKAGYQHAEIVGFLVDRKPVDRAPPDLSDPLTRVTPTTSAGNQTFTVSDSSTRPEGPSIGAKAEVENLRDSFFTGVDNARASVKTVNMGMLASRLQGNIKRLQDLEARGEGDSISARQMRNEIASVQDKLPRSIGEMTEAQGDAQRGAAISTRPAVAKVNAAKTWGEAWEAFKEAPYDVIAGVTATSIPSTLPALAVAAVMGPGAGAAVMGLNSATVEAGSSLADYARDAGVDVTNAKAVEAFFTDRDNLAAAMSYAGKRAGIIGALDAVSGGVAGKTIAPALKSKLAKQAVNLPAQMAVQAGLGAGGEALGQLATKGEIEAWGPILTEAVGEFGGAPAEVLAFSNEARKSLTPPVKPDPVAAIQSAPTVDAAIAAANVAISPNGAGAVDAIARILQTPESPNVSASPAIPGVAEPADGAGASDGAPVLDAGVGAGTAAGGAVDARGVGGQPTGGVIPLAAAEPAAVTPLPDAELAPVAPLTERQRLEAQRPKLEPVVEGEPAATWFGRRGDGYLTILDAEAALPSRQRARADLQWMVHDRAGRYYLAGYAGTAVKSGDATAQAQATQAAAQTPTGGVRSGIRLSDIDAATGNGVGGGVPAAAVSAIPQRGEGSSSPATLANESQADNADLPVAQTPPLSGVLSSEIAERPRLTGADLVGKSYDELDAMHTQAREHNRAVETEAIRKFWGSEQSKEAEGWNARRREKWLTINETEEASEWMQSRYINDELIAEHRNAVNDFDAEGPIELGRSIAVRAKDVDKPGFFDTPDGTSFSNALRYAKDQGWDLNRVMEGMRGRSAEWAGEDAPELFGRLFKQATGQPVKLTAQDAAPALPAPTERQRIAATRVEPKSERERIEAQRPAARVETAATAERAADANADQEPMFRRGTADGDTLRVSQIQRAVDKLTLNWLKKPDIHILDSMADAPGPVRAVWERQESQGAVGAIEGFHFRGGVYLVSDQLRSGRDIIRVLYHESLGHFGLRNVFGKDLDVVLKQVAMSKPREMRAKAEQYGFDLSNERQRMSAAEEILAEMAQARPESTLVQRALAVIRKFLRENVPGFADMKLTDAEIIQQFLVPARDFVEQGRRAEPSFSRGTTEPMASRKDVVGNEDGGRSADDETKGAAQPFDEWFAGSKVVDDAGDPLTVYHGTTSDIQRFDPSLAGANAHAFGKVVYFTSNPELASQYAETGYDREIARAIQEFRRIQNGRKNPGKDWLDRKAWPDSITDAFVKTLSQGRSQEGGGANVMPVHLSLKNPHVVDAGGRGFKSVLPSAMAEARANGRDGVIVKNVVDSASGKTRSADDVYIAFEASQIRSTFSSNESPAPNSDGASFSRGEPNPDIQFSRTATPDDVAAMPEKPELSPWRDATGRLQFAPGAWLWDKLGDAAGPLLAKVGLKAASPALRRQFRQMKLAVQAAQEKAAAVAAETNKLSAEEREMVSDLIEKEMKAGTIPPDHAVRLAALINENMNTQADELVRLGMLTKDSADMWRGKYLPRFYKSKLGKQVGDAWADALGRMMGRQKVMAGIKGKHLRGRGLYETIPVDQLENYKELGWEVRDPEYGPTATDVQVWRDFSREERDKMGEIRDAGFRFVMGYMQTQRDIALGRMFEGLANDADMSAKRESDKFSVHVPDGTVPGTGAKRYGKLSGRWVSKEVMSHLSQIEESQSEAWRMYRKALGIWKEGKTALNPVSHVNNIVSNLTMAHFAGVSYHRGDKYIAAARDFATKAPGIKEAKDAGLFLGTMSDAELQNILPEDLKALVRTQDSTATKIGRTGFNMMTFWLRRPMGWAYQAEDTFFRYLIYKDARDRGMEPQDAVDHAQEFIFTYDDLPKGARLIRDFGIPFFSYTYKAAPALLHTALTHPVRMAAPAAVLWGINAAAYAIAVGDDEDSWDEKLQKYLTDADYREQARAKEKLEREHLPSWNKGTTSLMTPKMIRLGIDELTKLPLFIDVSRIIPGGDLFDVSPNAGGIPLPQPLTPSHPLFTTAVAMIGNKDLFRGKDLVDSNDTKAEATEKRLEWLWTQISPAIAAGNYHWERGMNAIAQANGGEVKWMPDMLGGDATGVGKDGLPTQTKYAIAQTFGIKIRTFDLDANASIDKNLKQKMVNDIDSEIRKLQRLRAKGAISDRVMDKEREASQLKKERIREGLTVDGDARP